MKNYKKNLIYVFVGCFSFFCFADGRNFSFSIEPCFGIRNGVLDEFVYENENGKYTCITRDHEGLKRETRTEPDLKAKENAEEAREIERDILENERQ